MSAPRVLCFGEVLWDLLPSGPLPGGAPLNVAYHLRKLGADPLMVSAVGLDVSGDEMLACLAACGLDTRGIARHAARPTGTVNVTLGADGQPAYEIVSDVAWDEIPCDEAALTGVAAFVFGSLAARSPANRATLDRLLAVPGVLRVMDVNLRAPFDARDRVLELARRAEVLKLNEDELARLCGYGYASAEPRALAQLAQLTGCPSVCVTRGARGAVWWRDGECISEKSPTVRVRDTIGAGDAFTAALVCGLLANDPPAQILRRACSLGALVASRAGGQPDYDPAPFE